MVPDVLLVLKRVAQTLDQLNIHYLVGGSVASSTLGKFRYTNDIDFVVDLHRELVPNLVSALADDFYIDADTILAALEQSSSFSILHLATMVKADMFIRPTGAWSDSAWNRRKLQRLETAEHSVEVYVPSVEDMIIQKLNWYRLGREVSDRQWSDIIGMLEVQSAVLDFDYMEKWALSMNLLELLQRAYQDSGIGAR